LRDEVFKKRLGCLSFSFCIRVNVHLARQIRPVFTPFLLLAQSFLPLYFSLHSLNKASPSFKWFWYSKPLVNWVDVLTFLFQRYLNLENWKFLYAYILCPILIKTVGNFFFFLLYLQSLIRPLVRLIDADKIHHRKSLD
jgi:hypothetical protein